MLVTLANCSNIYGVAVIHERLLARMCSLSQKQVKTNVRLLQKLGFLHHAGLGIYTLAFKEYPREDA